MPPRSDDIFLQSEDSYDSQVNYGPAIDVRDLVLALRRNWWFPVLGCVLGLALGLFYVSTFPSLYRSNARILVDRSTNRYLQTNKIVAEPIFDQTELESQIHILSSDGVIIPVVRSLNLASDREFVGPPGAIGPRLLGGIGTAVKAVRQSLSWGDDATADASVDRDVVLERTAVEALLKHLSVYREDVANVITVAFASEDRNKAARIVNAIADTYLATNLEAKAKSTKIASHLLQDRLMELKVQAIEADRALQNYKAAHNLENTEKGLPITEQISSVSADLTKARIALAESKARLDRIRDASNSDGEMPITDASNDSIIVKLRTQYLDLVEKEAEINARLEPGHNALIKLRRRMAELRASIRTEGERLAAIEYQNARAREQELAAAVERLQEQAKTMGQAQVTMRDLESSAETSRSLYSSLLQKFQEISASQTQSASVQDVVIVTRAVPPLQKTSNKSILVLGGGLVFGLLLGAGAAIGKEWAADVFRNADMVTRASGIHSVILPAAIRKPKRTGSVQADTKAMPIEEFVLDEPYSRFTEALRSIKALINAAQHTGNVKVIGVVSSLPKEGKTTVAANLGALMLAASAPGTRVLIIDGDLHLRNLTGRLAPDAHEGLIEALADPSRLAALVRKRQRSGIDVLPCVLSARLPNAADLLGSPQMERLLDAARKSYDFIIIEVPPIMSVVDIKVVERLIDRFVFVIEWGQTKRRLVLEALAEAPMIRERILGMILNKADPSALRVIESYKGARFKDYYEA